MSEDDEYAASQHGLSTNQHGTMSEDDEYESESDHHNPDNSLFVLYPLPLAPIISSKPIKLNNIGKRNTVIKTLCNKGHTKCLAAFVRERTRADDSLREAENQNELLNKFRAEMRSHITTSQSFMADQQKKLQSQSEKAVQLAIENKQLTDANTALNAKVKELEKAAAKKQGTKNTELRKPEKTRIKSDGKRIATLNALGFDLRLSSTHTKYSLKSFEERIENLRSYKEKHGNLSVRIDEDKTLAGFCSSIRYARKHPGQVGRMKLNEEHIASLNALGFDWRLNSTHTKYNPKKFEERIEDLRRYKEKNGHLNVKQSEDKSLGDFCRNIRHSRKNPGNAGKMKLNEERIASLDALGFDWRLNGAYTKNRHKSCEERIEDLKWYKEKNGHLGVKQSQDKSLADFCTNIRHSRRNLGSLGQVGRMKLNQERIASLDALGFDWRLNDEYTKRIHKSFEERIEDLRSYKEKHGHLNVKPSQDKSLAAFCIKSRHLCKHPGNVGGMKLNEERIASLDALGFDWRQALPRSV